MKKYIVSVAVLSFPLKILTEISRLKKFQILVLMHFIWQSYKVLVADKHKDIIIDLYIVQKAIESDRSRAYQKSHNKALLITDKYFLCVLRGPLQIGSLIVEMT